VKFISQLLGAQLARHPDMQPADVYKLLHQAALGPAHAVSQGDAEASLLAEIATLPARAQTDAPQADPLFEVISPDGRLARVHLRPYLAAGHEPAALARAFAETAAGYQGSVERLAKFCACLGDLADAGGLPFPRAAVEAFMNARREEGWPAVRHSEAYRAAHAPAYRVVDLQLLPALAPAANAGA
jgi:hypothetical protein